jgi:HK97 family phage prohead protease
MKLIRKNLDFDIKQVGVPSDRVLEFVGSTAGVDRYGDIIEVEGWELDNYLQNPVFLWAHDYKQPPIGKAVAVEKTSKGLVFRIKFAEPEVYPFADTIFKLYLGGYLRATSVGFRDIEREPITDKDGRHTGWHYKRQELWELSAVPVPANPEALIMAVQKGVVSPQEVEEVMEVPYEDGSPHLRPYPNEHACRLQDPEQYEEFRRKNCAAKVDGKCVDHIYGLKDGKTELQGLRYRLEEGWTEAQARANCEKHNGMFEPAAPEEKEGEKMDAEIKGVIPYKEYPTEPEDAPWDGPAEIKAAEVDDLKVICTWFDSDNPDIKNSYKLPHHRAKGYKVVWRGVAAAMAALMGARGGVNIPEADRQGVYNHLAKHYAQFDKEPPELKAYTPVDLLLIEMGLPPVMDKLANSKGAVSGQEIFQLLLELLSALYDWLLGGNVGGKAGELPEPVAALVADLKSQAMEMFAQGSAKALHEFFKAGDGPVVKAGAVLSAKNKAALKQAQALIQEVLDSAEPAVESNTQTEQNKSNDIYSLALNPGTKPHRGRPAGEVDIPQLLGIAQKLHHLVKGG